MSHFNMNNNIATITTTQNRYSFPSSQWTNNFYHKWRQQSTCSKCIFSFSMSMLVLQLTSIAYVLYSSYDLICQEQEPFRLWLIVHAMRHMMHCPINIYLHFGYLEPYEYDQIDNPFNHTRLYLTRLQTVLHVFSIIWFLCGNYLVFFYNSDLFSCDLTAANLTKCIVIYGFIIISLPVVYSLFYYILLPCFLALLRSLNLIPSKEEPGASSMDISSLRIYRFHHSNVFLGEEEEKSGQLPILFIPQAQDQFCVICQSKYQDDQIVCKLWCDHHFCKKCIFEWLKLNAKCPLCKRDCKRRSAQQDILQV